MTTPFVATIDHLSTQLAEQRVGLAAAWLEALDRMLPVETHDVFPTPTLLDHIPELIAHIALYVRAPSGQEIEANTAVMQKATELGVLRFDQRASVGQLLREYQVFAEILDGFFAREVTVLGTHGDPAATALAVSRTHTAVRALQQRTVDVLVANYTDRIQRKTTQLRNFSQLVSHEIRQPLGVLQVLARVLRSPDAAEDHPRMVDTLERNVVRLGEVADKLERMARLTRPQEAAEGAPVDVAALAQALAAQLADEASAQGVAIEVADGLPLLEADAGRVELVLANLLSNAIKYRDPAKATRSVRVEPCPDAALRGLRVSDNGLGIPQAKLDAIFDHFTRAHAHLDEELGTRGLGLGLAIVRDCMDTMGGKITVASEEGRGTTFTLEWPTRQPDVPLPR